MNLVNEHDKPPSEAVCEIVAFKKLRGEVFLVKITLEDI